MTTLREAAQQALEALEESLYATTDKSQFLAFEAITTLRAALAEPVQEPVAVDVESALQAVAEKIGDQCAVWYGIGARDVEEVLREAARHGLVHGALAEPVQEPQCNPHPKAPHGFLRNASHTEDRYVCECEYWEPYEAGYQAGMEAALAEPVQEPVATVELMMTGGNAGLATRIVEIDDHLRERLRPGQLLYTAPPQRKPLTEEEIDELSRTMVKGDRSVNWLCRAIERAHGITGETA